MSKSSNRTTTTLECSLFHGLRWGLEVGGRAPELRREVCPRSGGAGFRGGLPLCFRHNSEEPAAAKCSQGKRMQ